MNSLPVPVEQVLQGIVTDLDEGLQARVHAVDQAQQADRAFRRSFTVSPLLRALLCDILRERCSAAVRVDELGNGGCEVVLVHRGVERRFRLKAASRDHLGRLVVQASSDSILTNVPTPPTLFDPPGLELASTAEQWVLAYMLDERTRTFTEVTAGRVVGKVNDRPPYRLTLADLVPFALVPPVPPSFTGSEDDLDLGGGEHLGDEEAG